MAGLEVIPEAVVEFGSSDVLTKDENTKGALGYGKCAHSEASAFTKAECAN